MFDEDTQCRAALPDTAVCADMDDSPLATNYEAVIPWLGGDYNPWEACDTLQKGYLVNGEYANEEIESSCHPVICNKGSDSPYYKFYPSEGSEYRCACMYVCVCLWHA